jgi:hypothetical protein
MEPISFRQAISEVGEWSQRNFGDQKGAGALAPLAGIVEEIGECAEATKTEDVVDAYVDQLVYLADVCYRCGIVVDAEWNIPPDIEEPIEVSLGRLAHAVLKRHQGIRGYDQDEKFIPEATEAATEVFHSIQEAFYYEDCIAGSPYDLGEEFTKEWRRVKKRDWKKNPGNANEVAS